MISWKCLMPAFAALALAACSSTSPVQPGGGGSGGGGAGGSPGVTAAESTAMSSSTGAPPSPPLCSDPGDATIPPGALDPSVEYHSITGPNNQSFVVVAVDGKSNVILAGSTVDVADFGAGPVPAVNTTPDQADLFVAKYDPTGTLVWVRRFAAAKVRVTGIAVDGQDNIAVTGSYINGPMDFGATVLAMPGELDGADRFVAELASDGTFRWARTIGGPGFDDPGKVAIAPGNDVLVAGSDGEHRISLSRFSPLGEVVFQSASAKIGGKVAFEAPIDVVRADSHGDFFVTGTGGYDFEGAPESKGSIFIAKYSGINGSLTWVRRFPGIGFDESNGDQAMVIVGDDVVIAGLTLGTIDLGNGILSEACTGTTAMYLARLSGADGGSVWSRGIRAEGALFPELFLDSQGRVVLTAVLGGPSDPGGGIFPNIGAFAMTYDAATGAFDSARERLEASGLYLHSGNQSSTALDATGHLVTATTFYETTEYGLGTITSTGWGDVLITRASL